MQPSARNLRFRCASQAKLGRDFLTSVSRDFGSPRRRPTSRQSRRSEDLPGYWAVLFVRAAVQHPAGYDPSLPLLLFEKVCGEIAIAFTENRTLGIRNEYSFRSHLPTAHTLAYLRFADLVTETVARLTTGSDGLTPSRAGFAPAGRHTKFHGVIAIPPIPIDQQSLVALNYLSAPICVFISIEAPRAGAETPEIALPHVDSLQPPSA